MRALRVLELLVVGLSLVGATGCSHRGSQVTTASPVSTGRGGMFQEVAAASGISFQLGHSGRSPLSILETAPGGCGFFDFDLDGNLDAVLVGESMCRVYRNLGKGMFQDVTVNLGIPVGNSWMGCAVADYDGDGFPDLLLTGYRTLALLKNVEGRRFVDRTKFAGLIPSHWTTSADFSDVDRDGDLDLYVGAYVAYHRGMRDFCRLGTLQSACGPEIYSPEQGRFYRNQGDGRFRDETKEAGLAVASGKTWGVIFSDFDRDGWPDLYLGNDMVACNLFRNTGNGQFQDVGLGSGAAYDSEGRPMGAMGIDVADANGDHRPDLFVATYAQQPDLLFLGFDQMLLRESSSSKIGPMTRALVGFGGGFIDVDNDGDLDLFIANGHVRDNIHRFDAAQEYRQRMQLLLNRGDGTFEDGTAQAGTAFAQPLVGRGAAFGDYDNDGDVDILVVDLEGRARLLRNDFGKAAGHWLRIRVKGTLANNEALGASITVSTPERSVVRVVKRGGSVLSSHDAVLVVGLGSAAVADVSIRWPDSSLENWKGLVADRTWSLNEHAPNP